MNRVYCHFVLNRASSYAERLRLRIAVIHGQKEIEHDDDETDGRNSPPPMIEQEPEEPVTYTPPTGMRRKRNDSSKHHLLSKLLEWLELYKGVLCKYLKPSNISDTQFLIEHLHLSITHLFIVLVREYVYNFC